MPRTVPSSLLTVINSEVPTLATLVKVTRQDGTVFGFTSFDVDITLAGVTYEKNSCLQATAIRQTSGTAVDNLDAMGLLNSNRITDADILAGLYDLATVEIDLVDYTNPSGGVMVLMIGTLGEINFQDGQFIAEFRSLAQRLQQEIVDLVQPTCRVAAFGDSLTCASGGLIGTHVLSFYQRLGLTVASVVTAGLVFTVNVTDTSGFFDYGKITFTSGNNKNIVREIKSSPVAAGVATITVQEAFPFAIQVGDVLTLEAGCDRNFSTCVNKFQNQNNFRGEPHVPGTDQMFKRGRR